MPHIYSRVPAKKWDSHMKHKILNCPSLNVKMAIILPTGQWYAPSAVINDAWYCMVLHGIALYWIVLHGIAWY